MAQITCPSCSAQTSDLSGRCAVCGADLAAAVPPIRKLSGKLSVLGVVIIAMAIIGTALGTWWGPAALLPGVAFFMMAKFL